MKTTRGSVFGGFTDISWTSGYSSKSGNGNSFLFLVGEDKSVKLWKCKDPREEVYHHSKLGPCFGFDLTIGDNCNNNRYSWAKLGESYGSIKVLDQGKVQFQVQEIEVFRVE